MSVWLILSSWAQPSGNLIQTPVVPDASPQARALLHYLQSQRGQHILSGQNEDTDNVLWNKDGQGGKEIPFIHRITGTNLEAEAATALGGVSLVTYTNANFTGWGYADLSGKNGTNYVIRWNTSQASATALPLSFRFANGSTSTRYLHLIINGATNSTLTFPPTGSWDLFSNLTTPAINFPSGAVVIDLVPSAGTSGPNIDKLEADFPSIVGYEAETALLEGGVVASASNGGYTGSGYADYPGATGTGVRIVWTVNSASAGNRELSFRYANGGATARPLHLVVNGGTPILLNFDPTGAWNTWELQQASAVPLNAGNNTIELRASAGAGGPNVDRLDVNVPAMFNGQAEDATLLNVSAVFVNNAFTGTGFAQFPTSQGSGVLLGWNLSLPSARTMPLAVRYANGTSTNRLLQLKINGTNAAVLTFPPSDDWTTYFTLFSPVFSFPSGSNTVELVASAGTAGPYIDSMQHSGKIPAIRAFDFIWDNQSTYDQYNGGVVRQQRNVQRAIDWWNNGGIVAWQWHWFIPKIGGGGTFGTQVTFDMTLATTPGTTEYNYLIEDMDIAATNLVQLRNAGVPVLWRPYHEAGGQWFWWGKDGPATYKKLWAMMFNRFTYHHNLTNLIWVNNTDFILDDWYPGDDTVDIISSDQYAAPGVHDVFASAWDKFNTFNAPGKIIAMSENGPIPDPAQLQAQSVGWAYFCTWSSSFILDGKQNPVADIISIYNHPYVLNRGDLPDLKTLAAPAVGPATELAFSRPVLETALGFAPPRVVTVEPVDANGRVVRNVTGDVELRWEKESAPLVSSNLVRGVASYTLPVLQRPQNGQNLIATLTGLTGISPEAVVGPGSGYKWERWNYAGNLGNDWNSQRATILASAPTFTGEAAVSSAIPSSLTTNDNFVVRLTGSIIAPTNGNYSFWVYGDDRAELWLQTSLASTNLTKVAHNSQSQSKDQWDEEAIQHSGNYTLEAGKAYNFQCIMAEFGGNAWGAFGWTLPDGTLQRPIPGAWLQLPGGYRFNTWASREGMTGTNATFTADPDGDGRGNFLEFALGLSPSRADAEPQWLIVTNSSPRYTLPIPSGDDAAVTIHSTANLASGAWTAIATWTAAAGWTIPGGVTGVSLSLATNELLDNRGADKTFYRIEAAPLP
jgi:hypothetical protein